MTVADARGRLAALARRWRRRQALALALRLLGLALVLGAVALAMGLGTGGLIAALAVAALAAWWLPHPPRADAERLARHLDRRFAELEESTTLMLRPDASLAPLERLQRGRVLGAFAKIETGRVLAPAIWRGAAAEALAGALTALLVTIVVARFSAAAVPGSVPEGAGAAADLGGAALAGVELTVVPPAYTGAPQRRQSELDVEAEEGGTVTWTAPAVDSLAVALLTGTGERLDFGRAGDELTLSRPATESMVYRLLAERGGREVERTAFARFAVLLDEAPSLAVVNPVERVTEIQPGAGALDVEVEASDDYGLASVDLVATLALGDGELVEFRERRFPLGDPDGAPEATFRHRLDLERLGLGPAAELYLWVEARDGKEPEPNLGRSPTTIVRVPGEHAASVGLGEGLPIVLPPAYFRSQRQIILDTEKLVADAPELAADEVRRRSEALGMDQRALRMRYGALLGEEFVSGQSAAPDDDEEEGEEEEEHHHDHAEEGEVETSVDEALEGVPEGLFHAHDSSEIATYFTSETRTLLRQVLAEMWEAEGRLRVVDPAAALPFEYRALVLLKDLQQRSRVYAQKVGFEAPPLETERRLTGELDEIRTRHRELVPPESPEVEAAARELVALLERGAPEAEAAAPLAAQVRPQLARLAAAEPEALAALEALDDVLAGEPPPTAGLERLEAVLWRLVPAPDPVPAPPALAADPLSTRFRELTAQEEGR